MHDEAVWRAIADPTRRQILDLLRSRPHTTGELASLFAMSRYGVMKHLRVLVEANLVLVRRRGRHRWNYLNVVPLQEAISRWASPFQRETASSLFRLREISEAIEGRGSRMIIQSGLLQIEQEIQIQAAPETVYRALTRDVNAWWSTGYRLIDEDSTISLDARIGGFFHEHRGEREATWATVTAVEPGSLLELTGRMGMEGAVFGVISYELEADGAGTLLRLSHHAIGEVDDGTEASYRSGWQYLLGERLKAHVEG